MRILLLGEGGGIGRLVLEGLLDRGDDVIAAVRDTSLFRPTAGLAAVEGTVMDAAFMTNVAFEVDAVILAIGHRRSGLAPIDRPDLLEAATRIVLDVMAEHGVRRLVVVSANGVGDSWAGAPWWYKQLVQRTAFGKIWRDQNAVDALVRASGTDWTLIRPARTVNLPGGRDIKQSYAPQRAAGRAISRDDVARFVVAAVHDAELIGTAPIIAN